MIMCKYFQNHWKMFYPPIIHYEQSFDGPSRHYYDPHIFRAEKSFSIRPGEYFLIVLSGRGWRFHDDIIYHLQHRPQTGLYVDEKTTQLCLLVVNKSSEFTIHVGQQSPLFGLLNMSQLHSQLCYCDYNTLITAQSQAGTEKTFDRPILDNTIQIEY